MGDSPVQCTELALRGGRRMGLAVLNAERSLNSLTLAMVDALHQQLAAWEQDPAIACVVLRGAGERAFCAGADVVALARSAQAGDGQAEAFFTREYALDHALHNYSRPLLVWGSGIVMGGGLGLLVGASHRVVTDTTRMAMPEVTIGLFPDVGATFFLPRVPGRGGLFLALTGVPIQAADALYAGLADRCLRHGDYDELLTALQETDWPGGEGDHHRLSDVLRRFETRVELPEAQLRRHDAWIRQVTDADDLTQIVARIEGYEGDDPWLQQAARTLATACPTTLRLVEEQFRRGRHLSLKEAFQLELVLAWQCLRHPNFAEGVRALLIDKDRQPRFEPDRLEAVTPEWVAGHFQPPWPADQHPLANL